MFKALEGLMPSFFSSEEEYETARQEIFSVIQDATDLDAEQKGITAQEVNERVPYGIQTITARVNELRDDYYVARFGSRECNASNHSREVNQYVAPPDYTPEEV